MRRWFFVLFGASWCLSGLVTLISQGPKRYPALWGISFTYSQDEKWLLGIGLFLFGLLFIWSGFRKKGKYYLGSLYMCIKCREPVYGRSAPDLKCQRCGMNLEPLKGFYERHPELKDDD